MSRPMSTDHPGDALLMEFKAVLRSGLHRYEIDQDDLAEWCLVDQSTVSHWVSRKCRDTLGAQHVALLTKHHPRLARGLMEWLGEHTGLLVAPRLARAERAHVVDLLGSMAKEGAELHGALARMLREERPSTAALKEALAELEDVERETASARAMLEHELAERGPALRAVGGGS